MRRITTNWIKRFTARLVFQNRISINTQGASHEHPPPRVPPPQFERNEWIDLNGPWTYRFDPGRSGLPLGRGTADSWGYGNAPQTLDEFYERLEGLVDALLERPEIQGYCYTQLTDVEQEQNGIYYYDRSEKFDMSRVTAAFSKTPA